MSPLPVEQDTANQMDEKRFVSSLNGAGPIGETPFARERRHDSWIELGKRHSITDLTNLTLLNWPSGLNQLTNEPVGGMVAKAAHFTHLGVLPATLADAVPTTGIANGCSASSRSVVQRAPRGGFLRRIKAISGHS